jgi:hypothetical protein
MTLRSALLRLPDFPLTSPGVRLRPEMYLRDVHHTPCSAVQCAVVAIGVMMPVQRGRVSGGGGGSSSSLVCVLTTHLASPPSVPINSFLAGSLPSSHR